MDQKEFQKFQIKSAIVNAKYLDKQIDLQHKTLEAQHIANQQNEEILNRMSNQEKAQEYQKYLRNLVFQLKNSWAGILEKSNNLARTYLALNVYPTLKNILQLISDKLDTIPDKEYVTTFMMELKVYDKVTPEEIKLLNESSFQKLAQTRKLLNEFMSNLKSKYRYIPDPNSAILKDTVINLEKKSIFNTRIIGMSIMFIGVLPIGIPFLLDSRGLIQTAPYFGFAMMGIGGLISVLADLIQFPTSASKDLSSRKQELTKLDEIEENRQKELDILFKKEVDSSAHKKSLEMDFSEELVFEELKEQMEELYSSLNNH